MTQESHSWVFAPNDENYVQTKTYILMLMPDCALGSRKFEECFPETWIQAGGEEGVEKTEEEEEEGRDAPQVCFHASWHRTQHIPWTAALMAWKAFILQRLILPPCNICTLGLAQLLNQHRANLSWVVVTVRLCLCFDSNALSTDRSFLPPPPSHSQLHSSI